MPDVMQQACDAHPELTVCATLTPAPDVHQVMDQAYDNLVLWLGGLGADTFWMVTALALGFGIVLTLLTVWTAHAGPRSSRRAARQ